MIRGTDRAVEAAQKEEDEMYKLFFVKGSKDRASIDYDVKDYLKDHVSKDLDIPYHQIKVEQIKMWREKGFRPVDYETWWREPNAEEKKRTLKMMSGASIRKGL